MKPNPRVSLSTGVKATTEASKPMPKKDTQTNRSLPAQHVQRKRVEAHTRNLNKTNRAVSNSIAVCKMCNGCYFSVNHDKCVVRYLKSVNAKKVKNVPPHTKQVWQAKKPSRKSTRKPTEKPKTRTEWRPTGRTFSMFEKCPMTRIVETPNHLVEDITQVSSSLQNSKISRFPDSNLNVREGASQGLLVSLPAN